MAQQPTAERKERDIDSIVRYLTTTFNNATSKLERPFRSSKTGESNLAYKLQTEFAFRLNEVMQGPRGVLQKNIAECNEFIDFAMSEVAKVQQQ
jgi:hypothetical protein